MVATRSPHVSAAHLFKQFLLADMYDYEQMGYWTILPYQAIRHHPTLWLSPSGVVPQSDCRPRPIRDYSFYSLNADSLPLSPAHAMQFGHT
jgi:hypothetical protein